MNQSIRAAAIAVCPGVEHIFHNDASGRRYDQAAAERACSRTLAFLREPVGG